MSFATDYNKEGRPGTLSHRGIFITPWYKPHENLDLPVTQHGKPLGFKIADVAVERRWAIDANGEVMDSREFIDRLTEWYIGQWSWQSPPMPPLQIDTCGYPTVDNFVAKGPDPANQARLRSLKLGGKRNWPGMTSRPDAERPVDVEQLSKPASGWKLAPKKE